MRIADNGAMSTGASRDSRFPGVHTFVVDNAATVAPEITMVLGRRVRDIYRNGGCDYIFLRVGCSFNADAQKLTARAQRFHDGRPVLRNQVSVLLDLNGADRRLVVDICTEAWR